MANSDKPGFQRVDVNPASLGYDNSHILNSYIPGYTNVPIQYPDQPTSPYNSTPVDSRSGLAQAYSGLSDSVVRIESTRPQLTNGRVNQQTIAGSGFFVESDGTIATDYHVVQGATKFNITTASGRSYTASLDVVDPSHDLALLRVDNTGPNSYFPALQLASPNDLSQGSNVLALGFPQGWRTMFASPGQYNGYQPLSNILTDLKGGLLPGESPQRPLLDSYIHVDEGNSGGPLLNDRFQVVGLVDISNQKNDAQATPVQDLNNLLAHSQQLRNRIQGSNSFLAGLSQSTPQPNLQASLQSITALRQRFSQSIGYGGMDYAQAQPSSNYVPQPAPQLWMARPYGSANSGTAQEMQSIDSMRQRMFSHMLGG